MRLLLSLVLVVATQGDIITLFQTRYDANIKVSDFCDSGQYLGYPRDAADNSAPLFPFSVGTGNVLEVQVNTGGILRPGYVASDCSNDIGSLVGFENLPGQFNWTLPLTIEGDVYVNDFAVDSGAGTHGQEKVTGQAAHTGVQSWRLTSGFSRASDGTPHSPRLDVDVGKPATGAAANRLNVSFWFKPAAPGDESKVILGPGADDPTLDFASTQVQLVNAKEGVLVRTLTHAGAGSGGAFSTENLHRTPLNASVWNRFQMMGSWSNPEYGDNWVYAINGELVDGGNTYSAFFSWRRDEFHEDHVTTNWIKFRTTTNVDPSAGTVVGARGFYFDDIEMVAAADETVLDSWSTSFEPRNDLLGDVVFVVPEAVDPDGDNVTYTLGQTWAGDMEFTGLFLLSGRTVHLAPDNEFDFEGPLPEFNVTVIAHDNAIPSKHTEFRVNVLVANRNEAVTLTSPPNATVFENAPLDTPVYTATSVDIDAGNTAQYTLEGGAVDRFTMDTVTGVMTTAYVFDFEEDAREWSVTVRATDSGFPALTDELNVTVFVLDANDPPAQTCDGVVTAGCHLVLPENAPPGTPIFTLTSFDQDVNQTASYTGTGFVNPFNRSGLVVAPDGTVTVGTGPGLNFEVECGEGQHDAGNPVCPSTCDDCGLDVTNSTLVTVWDAYGRLFNMVNTTTNATDARCCCTDCPAVDGLLCCLETAVQYPPAPTFTLLGTVTDVGEPGPPEEAPVSLFVTLENVNEAPFFTSLTGFVDENSPVGTHVGYVTFDDFDYGDEGTIVEVGGDTTLFEVTPEGNVTLTGHVSFEDAATRLVEIQVTDLGVPAPQLSTVGTLNIVIGDVNDVPVYTGASFFEIPENLADFSTVVYTAESVDEDSAHTHDPPVYGFLDGNATGFLDLNQLTGEMRPNRVFNFEEDPTRWAFVVRVFDNGSPRLLDTQNVTVWISDQNDAPVFELDAATGAAVTVEENTPVSTTVYTVVTTDEDFAVHGDVPRYALTAGDTALFDVDPLGGNISVAAGLDFEALASPELWVTVEATDSLTPPNTVALNVSITILDVNDPPAVTSPPIVTVDENQAPGAVVYNVTVFDQDGDVDAGVFTLVSQAPDSSPRLFSVAPPTGALTLDAALDFETQASYDVVIVFSDAGSPTRNATLDLHVVVVDGNEPPVITSSQFVAIEEGTPVGTLVYTAVVVEEFNPEDNATFSITGGSFGALFEIGVHDGQLRPLVVFNFEDARPNRGFVELLVEDIPVLPGSLRDTLTLVVDVLDVNDPPAVVSEPSFQYAENIPVPPYPPVFLFAIVDEDVTGEVYRYSWEGGNATDDFILGPVTGNLYGARAVDYEAGPVLVAVVRATSNNVPPTEVVSSIVINIVDVPESPVYLGATVLDVMERLPAGSTAPGINAYAHDDDRFSGEVVTHTLDPVVPDAAIVLIDPLTAEFSFTHDVDFETQASYDVVVRATDEAGFSITYNITLNVLDQNEPPTMTGVPFGFLEEGVAPGVLVASMTFEDQEVDVQSYSCSIVGGSPGFDALRVDGVCNLVSQAVVNFDTEPTVRNVSVVVTDNGDPQLSSEPFLFTLYILSVDEAPFVTSATTIFVDESEPQGALVHTVETGDPDGDTNTVMITFGNQCRFSPVFSLDATSGALTIADWRALNYDFCRRMDVSVTVSNTKRVGDPRPVLFIEFTLVVNVIDSAKPPFPPTLGSDSLVTIQEDAPLGTLVYTVVALDADGDDSLFSFFRGNGCRGLTAPFALNAVTGEVTTVAALDHETCPQFDMLITATNIINETINDPQSNLFTVQVFVSDVNEPPSIVSPSGFELLENTVAGTVVYVPEVVDADANEVFTFALATQSTAGVFSVDTSTGDVAVTREFNWEVDGPLTFWFDLTAFDSNTGVQLNDVLRVHVNLTDANDLPTIIAVPTAAVAETFHFAQVFTNVSVVDEDGPEDTSRFYVHRVLSVGSDGVLSLTSDFWQSAFLMNPVSGQLSSVGQLDAETFDQLVVQIRAENFNFFPPQTAYASILVFITDSNDAPTFPSLRQVVHVPEHLLEGSFIGLLPPGDDADGGNLTYYVHETAEVVVPDPASPALYLTPGLTFDVWHRGDTHYQVLYEARDAGEPTLSGWLFLDVTVTATTVAGPATGNCFIDFPCVLRWRGAGGGWPWSTNFLAVLFQRAPGGLILHKTLAVLTRGAESPAGYTIAGIQSDLTPVDDASGVVSFTWTPPATTPVGQYALEVTTPVDGPEEYRSYNISADFDIRPPFEYRVTELGGCTFPGAASCGNGVINRLVECVDITDAFLNEKGVVETTPVVVGDNNCRRFTPVRPSDTEFCFEACIFDTLKLGPWSTCGAHCAPGVQTRESECIGRDGFPSGNCTVDVPDAVRDCPSSCLFTRRDGPWSTCSTACGSGSTYRTTFCQTVSGRQLVGLDRCETVSVAQFEVSACEGNATQAACDSGLDVRVGPWAPCSATCQTLGEAAPTSTRSVVCVDVASGATLGDESCVAAGLPLPDREKPCNTAPCHLPHYVTGEWGACSATCGHGIKTRAVSCTTSDLVAVDDVVCQAAGVVAPPSTQECVRRTPCRCTSNDTCPFDNVGCVNVGCECVSGASGDGCQVYLPAYVTRCTTTDRRAGIKDVFDFCCAGDLDVAGRCCPTGASYDRFGSCCIGVVDVCGICNGPAVARDVNGVCCEHPLAANGLCCDVDECGVCGGNNECRFIGRLQGEVDVTDMFNRLSGIELFAVETALQQRIASVVELPTLEVIVLNFTEAAEVVGDPLGSRSLVTTGHTAFELSYQVDVPAKASALLSGPLWSHREGFLASPAAFLTASLTVTRSGICGNGVCEVDESCTDAACTNGGCPGDCPVAFGVCDGNPDQDVPVCSGHGLCLPSASTCECFLGYRGDACESCTEGLVQREGGGVCFVAEVLRPAPSATPSPTSTASFVAVVDDPNFIEEFFTDTPVTAAAVVVGVAACSACVVAVMIFRHRDSQRALLVEIKRISEASENEDYTTSDSDLEGGAMGTEMRQRLQLSLTGIRKQSVGSTRWLANPMDEGEGGVEDSVVSRRMPTGRPQLGTLPPSSDEEEEGGRGVETKRTPVTGRSRRSKRGTGRSRKGTEGEGTGRVSTQRSKRVTERSRRGGEVGPVGASRRTGREGTGRRTEREGTGRRRTEREVGRGTERSGRRSRRKRVGTGGGTERVPTPVGSLLTPSRLDGASPTQSRPTSNASGGEALALSPPGVVGDAAQMFGGSTGFLVALESSSEEEAKEEGREGAKDVGGEAVGGDVAAGEWPSPAQQEAPVVVDVAPSQWGPPSGSVLVDTSGGLAAPSVLVDPELRMHGVARVDVLGNAANLELTVTAGAKVTVLAAEGPWLWVDSYGAQGYLPATSVRIKE